MLPISMEVLKSDITELAVDAIVNAANTTLLGGGGVDGAIHRGAGPQLLAACRRLDGCRTGQAKLTSGYNLPARFVIHTVGPVWRGGTANEDRLLASCYRSCLEIAIEHQIKVIAFPAISTGAYRFPVRRAAGIAVGTVREFLAARPGEGIEKIMFSLFNDEAVHAYQDLLREKKSAD